MKNVIFPLSLLAAIAVAPNSTADFFVFESFNYANQSALTANWTLGTAPLSLNSGTGNPSPSVDHPGTSNSANLWSGSTFSLTPTDAMPVRLVADLLSSGNANQANSIGLRQNGGINPLFEMGMYRSFDNLQDGPTSAVAITPVQDGIGVRTINIGADLNGQDWVKMGANYTGWARFESTFTTLSVTTRVDLGIDGTWDLSYTETGTAPIAPFSQLRIHSPVTSTGGGFTVDNIVLETVPEPSTFALLGLGAAALVFRRRR